MIDVLQSWYGAGAHRALATPESPQYESAAAVAIMDQLVPTLLRSLFDGLLASGGIATANGVATGYDAVPMGFVNEPYNAGSHLGSAYDGGWEGYAVEILGQMDGRAGAQTFPPAVTAKLCNGGLQSCAQSIDSALSATYDALVRDNGGSTDVTSWTQDNETVATALNMPQYDAIAFRAIGIVGQPNIPWQNRPTFQQVVSFPYHRATT
jgi:hypothetical protein